jgi:hypothetical protein
MVKILEQMPADPNRQVELLDEFILQPVDPSLPVQQLLPGVVNTRASAVVIATPVTTTSGKPFPVENSAIALLRFLYSLPFPRLPITMIR